MLTGEGQPNPVPSLERERCNDYRKQKPYRGDTVEKQVEYILRETRRVEAPRLGSNDTE